MASLASVFAVGSTSHAETPRARTTATPTPSLTALETPVLAAIAHAPVEVTCADAPTGERANGSISDVLHAARSHFASEPSLSRNRASARCKRPLITGTETPSLSAISLGGRPV